MAPRGSGLALALAVALNWATGKGLRGKQLEESIHNAEMLHMLPSVGNY